MKTSVTALWTIILACFLLTGLAAYAAEPSNSIRVNPTHPKQYTVKKGDTLWDISGLFLKDPWYWPEIWNKNPQVENPHLIYPGDILSLIYIDGQPQIIVNQQVTQNVDRQQQTHTQTNAGPSRSRTDLPVVKLSPSVRVNSLQASVPSIPGDAIRQFTIKPRVITKKELEEAAYIIGSDDEHLVLAQGNRIYVRGELDKERVRFTVFRPGKELIDPETDETLGFEAIYAGEALIERYGDPSLGLLTFTEREVLIGDRLLPTDKSRQNNLYFPHVPEQQITGRIISLYDGLFGIAKFQVAVINRGTRDGIEVGHLLAALDKGKNVRDDYALRGDDEIELPDERSGLLMIFRTFGSVSYGLVMESKRVIHNGDVVSTPR